jgi:hypothetical protein
MGLVEFLNELKCNKYDNFSRKQYTVDLQF